MICSPSGVGEGLGEGEGRGMGVAAAASRATEAPPSTAGAGGARPRGQRPPVRERPCRRTDRPPARGRKGAHAPQDAPHFGKGGKRASGPGARRVHGTERCCRWGRGACACACVRVCVCARVCAYVRVQGRTLMAEGKHGCRQATYCRDRGQREQRRTSLGGQERLCVHTQRAKPSASCLGFCTRSSG